MISWIKSLVNYAGLRVSRTGYPFRSVGEALSVVRARAGELSLVIDVGVAQGTPELYRAFPKAKLVLIEPLQEFAPCIRSILAVRDGLWHQCVASDSDGEVEICVPSDLRKASVLTVEGVDRVVPSRRLDSLLDHSSFRPGVFLKVDVEGAELSALRGAKGILPGIDFLQVELALPFSVVGQPGDRYISFLAEIHESGFSVLDIIGAADVRFGGPLQHIDLLLGRNNSPIVERYLAFVP